MERETTATLIRIRKVILAEVRRAANEDRAQGLLKAAELILDELTNDHGESKPRGEIQDMPASAYTDPQG